MSTHRHTLIITSLIVLIGNLLAVGGWKENARVIDISGGEDHTLILTANKWPWACGDNYYYQLGIGSNVSKLTLVRVAKGDMNSPSDFLDAIGDVDAGWTHSLALDVNGLLCAWGRNVEGQLGDNQKSGAESLVPVRVHGLDDEGYLDDIVAISAGRSGRHSLAVDANGYAYAWGYNKYGQCGNGVSESNELTPVYVNQGEQPDDPNDPNDWLKHIIDICAGADQSIALENDNPSDPNFNGSVYTWGTNRWGDEAYEWWIDEGYGLLGTGSNANLSDTPVKVLCGQQHPDDPNQLYLNHIVAVAAGWDHCMALEKDDPYDPNIYNPAYTGRVFTWGNNGPGWGGGDPCNLPEEVSVGGRLGNGTYNDSNVPVLVLSGEQDPNDPNEPYLNHITAVSAGEGHSMALDANGYVYCWGDNQYGQLGNGRNEPCSAPVRVIAGMQNPEDPNSPLSSIVAISAGHWHSLAIDSDGVVWVWGKTKDGRLGLADMAHANPYVCAVPHRIPVVYNEGEEEFWFSINDAIDDPNTASGDVLEASWGVYYEAVNFGTDSLMLKSTDQNDWAVVGRTTIDARYSGDDGVTLNNNSGSRLAGLTVANSLYYGIDSYLSGLSVTNCIVRDNGAYGISNYNSTFAVVANNKIYGNAYCGITSTTDSSSVEIIDNLIYANGTPNGNGVTIIAGEEPVTIRNNTIVGNAWYGISLSAADDANIINCIIWDNGIGSLASAYYDVTYSCIEGGYTGTGNIISDPCFIDAEGDDFHLDANSLCIDKGDPAFVAEPNETDIDGEERVRYGRVDIGADEFYWSPADFNWDGIVNFIDYAMLAWHWHETDADAGYDDVFDLADNNAIDFADILEFCDEWLWQAAYRTGPLPLMAGRGGAGMVEGLGLDASLSAVASAEREPAVAEPVDIEAILKWLQEIWLDPEVREHIDAKAWLKFYESLNE